jgi:hypothetical protein
MYSQLLAGKIKQTHRSIICWYNSNREAKKLKQKSIQAEGAGQTLRRAVIRNQPLLGREGKEKSQCSREQTGKTV